MSALMSFSAATRGTVVWGVSEQESASGERLLAKAFFKCMQLYLMRDLVIAE